jgi:GAF domain-containing protein/two-component sensor histidine kinase
VGTLSADSLDIDAFSIANRRLLEAVAVQAAIAIEKTRLMERERERRHLADRLLDVSSVINSSLDLDEVLQLILDEMGTVVAYDSTSIQLLDRQENKLRVIACRGFDQPVEVKGLTFPIDDPAFPNYEVISRKEPYIVPDTYGQYPHFQREAATYHTERIRSMLGVPLIHRGIVIGMISIDKATRGYYTEESKSVAMTFANQAAIAIANARFYQEAAPQVKKWEQLVAASHKLIHYSSLEELYAFCAREAAAIFDVEDCSIYVKSEERQTIDLVGSSCIPPRVWMKHEARIHSPGLTAYVAAEGKVLNFSGSEVRKHPHWAGHHEDPFLEHLDHLPSKSCHSLLMGPVLGSRGQIVGVLKLENKNGAGAGSRFSPFEVAMHTAFATQLGIAIEARRRARDSLGDDLHDLMNFVNSTLVQGASYTKAILQRDQGAASGELDQMSRAAGHVYQTLKRIHQDVRDSILEEKGLMPALKHYTEMLQIKQQVEFVSEGKGRLPPHVEYALYKIAQEALLNAEKHGKLGRSAGAITVMLNKTPKEFRLSIADCGVGFYVDQALGRSDAFGLKSMERWATLIEARLEITSQPGDGTRVCVMGLAKEVKDDAEN